jgi:hypothetical protein
MADVRVVIPTIYSRPELLPLSVESILGQAGVAVSVDIYCPEALVAQLAGLFGDARVRVRAEAEAVGLAEKIDLALREGGYEFQTWLGDDDLLTEGSLAASVAVLEADSGAAMVYGGCDYIDASGRVLVTNRSGQWAAGLLRVGPQLIPQPGAVWRASAYSAAGGLDGQFGLAFDFDLFLKLSRVGRLVYVPRVLAQFRWHPDSLSVRKRWVSVTEASRVRRKHYRGVMRALWPLWEPWVVVATWAAGKLLSVRLRGSGRGVFGAVWG